MLGAQAGREVVGVDLAFIRYLSRRERLDARQRDRLTEFARHGHTPLGSIALSCALMTPEQIDAVLTRQPLTQERFGEAAVRMGYLHEAQVEALLAVQRFRRLTGVVEGVAILGVASLPRTLESLARFLLESDDGVVGGVGNPREESRGF